MADLNIFEIYTFYLRLPMLDSTGRRDADETCDPEEFGQTVWKWLQAHQIKGEVQTLTSYDDPYDDDPLEGAIDEEMIRVFVEGQDKAALFKMIWDTWLDPFQGQNVVTDPKLHDEDNTLFEITQTFPAYVLYPDVREKMKNGDVEGTFMATLDADAMVPTMETLLGIFI